jgi:hypothetical protein
MNIQVSSDGLSAVVQGANALITTKNDNPKPTTPVVDDYKIKGNKIAKWGDDNLFPQNVYEECRKNSIIGSTLKKQMGLLYAGGIYTAQWTGEFDDEGNEITKPVFDQNVEDFFKQNNIKKYLREAISDFYWFYNPFPELILSKNKNKITGISAQEAMFCRWSLQNGTTGSIDHCYINANWEGFKDENDPLTETVAVLDPYYDPISTLRGMGETKVIYPTSFPSPGKTYYQLSHWDSVRSGGWLSVAQSIPEFKKYMFENQITLRYHVQIPTSFWTWKYHDWDSFTTVQKVDAMKKEAKFFEDTMTGNKGSFKTLITSYIADEIAQKEYGKWIVTELGAKNNSNLYIEDSGEASSHLLYALGMDPTLVGYSIGKGMGAGSGSDKREAFNMYQLQCQMDRDIILEPLEFIRDYNNWNPKLRFKFRYGMLKTADKLKPTERSLSNESV